MEEAAEPVAVEPAEVKLAPWEAMLLRRLFSAELMLEMADEPRESAEEMTEEPDERALETPLETAEAAEEAELPWAEATAPRAATMKT